MHAEREHQTVSRLIAAPHPVRISDIERVPNFPSTLTASGIPVLQAHDCWNKIGVGGDQSCPELEKYFHCRNCPVYSEAGAQLLDRNLPASYRAECTEHFAAKMKDSAPGKLSLLIFQLGSEQFGLPTAMLQEFARHRPLHSLPHRRQGIVLGLINIGGELLICISLARLLGVEKEIRLDRTCERVLVLNWQGNRFAFPVGHVLGVSRFQNDELKTAPATVTKAASTLIRGIIASQGRSIGCLDENLLLTAFNQNLT